MTTIFCPKCSSKNIRTEQNVPRYDSHPYNYICEGCNCKWTYSYWTLLVPDPIIISEGDNID